jgi:acyl CoA:acetate/3-ketoacid CoA transferase alpha subunit/acyl CoA:acetate/3-ketoacid CoA transferase beta subunit
MGGPERGRDQAIGGEGATARRRSDKVVALDEAVSHVRAGDAVHLVCSHTRWTAAGRALVRRWWGEDPGWTLVMLSLSSLGTLFFRGGLVRKVVTGYSGDVFPNFTPNPRFGRAYLAGEVEVEHWSFLTFAQRMEAAARGLPALATASLAGSSMAANEGFEVVDTPFGSVGMVAAFAPDVALVHGAIADRAGNVVLHPPLLEGVWGALAARRGVIATVERVVDDIRPWSHLVQIPAHRTLAVAECPMGAHPGGLYGTFTPAEPYGEDLAFWQEARDASRRDDAGFDDWIRHWVLEPEDQQAYLECLGTERCSALRERADRDSWRADAAGAPPDMAAEANDWERAAVVGARVLAARLVESSADVVLAGAGVANLATWLAVEKARAAGAHTVLTAELGLVGYEPTPADPFVFNHRAFPSATVMGTSDDVLGVLLPGPGTTALACLGAAQFDAEGNINSTVVPGRTFLVGSGGGNDTASAADEVVVVTTLTGRRTVERCPYVTSPGTRVRAIATDLGVLERRGDRFVLTSVREGALDTIRERIAWELEVAEDLAVLADPTEEELRRLRTWDPHGLFLRG